MLRIILAGILGGVAFFICGAVEHMVFQWADRQMKRLPSEADLIEFVKAQKFEPGLYAFPDMPHDTPAEQREKRYADVNERYKQGPNGLLIVGPTGQDMMDARVLGSEAAANVGMALIAAWILTLLAPGTNYCTRWAIVFLMGVAAWLSMDASYAIWYRFPWPFIRDQLFCAMFEWGVAGIVIAAIAKPKQPPLAA
jgi:hypothetical protein